MTHPAHRPPRAIRWIPMLAVAVALAWRSARALLRPSLRATTTIPARSPCS